MPESMIRPNTRKTMISLDRSRPVEAYERPMVSDQPAKDYWPIVSLLVVAVMVGLTVWAGYALVLR